MTTDLLHCSVATVSLLHPGPYPIGGVYMHSVIFLVVGYEQLLTLLNQIGFK